MHFTFRTKNLAFDFVICTMFESIGLSFLICKEVMVIVRSDTIVSFFWQGPSRSCFFDVFFPICNCIHENEHSRVFLGIDYMSINTFTVFIIIISERAIFVH